MSEGVITLFSGSKGSLFFSVSCVIIVVKLLGRHGSASLCRVERENKMAATYNVLAFKR